MSDSDLRAKIASDLNMSVDALANRTTPELLIQHQRHILHKQGLGVDGVRELNERVDDFAVNVKDFGAVGDGVTDDTIALRAAISFLTAKSTLYFPPGIYLTDTLYVNISDVNVRGAGINVTVIKRKAAVNTDCRVFAFNSTGKTHTATAGTYLENITLQDMTVDGNNTNVNSDVNAANVQGTVFFGQIKNALCTNVKIINPREFGVHYHGCINGEINSTTVVGMLGDYSVNSINVAGDAYTGDPGWPVNIRPSYNIKVRNCTVLENWAKEGDSPAGGGIGICVQGSEKVSVEGCLVDFRGEPAARGRNGAGIWFEAGGGQNGHSLLAKNLLANGNSVHYAYVAISCMNSSTAEHNNTMQNVVFSSNELFDCVYGTTLFGNNISCSSNIINAIYGVVVGANAAITEENISITNNVIVVKAPLTVGALTTGISTDKKTVGGVLKGLIISNNIIEGNAVTSGDTFGFMSQGAVEGLVFSNNIIKNTRSAAVVLSPTGALKTSKGFISNNQFINTVTVTSGTVQYNVTVSSLGSEDILVAFNNFEPGAAVVNDTASFNAPLMTVVGNLRSGAVPALDSSNVSTRLGGPIWASRGGNAALAELLSALHNAQIIYNGSTA